MDNAQSEPTSSSKAESTSVNLNAQGDITSGGDIVGRDKIFIIDKFQVNVLPNGETEIQGSKIQPDSAATRTGKARRTEKSTSSHPKEGYRRETIYRLTLRGESRQIIEDLNRWRVAFAPNQPPSENQLTIAAAANEIFGIGQEGITTFCSPPVPELTNCSVECRVRIIDDGNDPTNWAGIRVRGFIDDIQFGYLIYMRRNGTVELYRTRTILAKAEEVVADTKNAWTRLRVDIIGSRIQVWVNDKLRITHRDTKLRDKGLVYLHTYGSHAQFRDIKVFRLVRAIK